MQKATAPKKAVPPKKLKKSGDSKLADAAAARERRRTQDHPEPGELIGQLQDRVELAKAKGATPDMLAKIQQALMTLTNVVENLQNRVIAVESGRKLDKTGRVNLLICPICHQYVKDKLTGRGICEGEHVNVRVLPTDMDLVEAFQGVQVNNRHIYYGWCPLPPAMKDSVLAQVNRWQAEHKTRFIQRWRIFGNEPRSDWASTAGSSVGQTPIIAAGMRMMN